MYVLPQASLIPNKLISKRLGTHGYYPYKFTPRLWRHSWQPITFALVVNYFGIKVKGDENANHLKTTLEKLGHNG